MYFAYKYKLGMSIEEVDNLPNRMKEAYDIIIQNVFSRKELKGLM